MMFIRKNRRKRESEIVLAMIGMYCKAHHGDSGSLCEACQSLADYAEKRLLSCLYGELKPVCKACPVHCYSPKMREQMKQVMQWAGPRMLYRKPLFALVHMIDNLTAPKTAVKTKNKQVKR